MWKPVAFVDRITWGRNWWGRKGELEEGLEMFEGQRMLLRVIQELFECFVKY
jgi:hypothetical protein